MLHAQTGLMQFSFGLIDDEDVRKIGSGCAQTGADSSTAVTFRLWICA